MKIDFTTKELENLSWLLDITEPYSDSSFEKDDDCLYSAKEKIRQGMREKVLPLPLRPPMRIIRRG